MYVKWSAHILEHSAQFKKKKKATHDYIYLTTLH